MSSIEDVRAIGAALFGPPEVDVGGRVQPQTGVVVLIVVPVEEVDMEPARVLQIPKRSG